MISWLLNTILCLRIHKSDECAGAASIEPAAFAFGEKTMKDYAASFYKSKAWQACRAGYMAKVGGLCEDCLAKGIYTAAEIVHHVEELTPENIGNPEVALNWNNLRAVCRECHAVSHGARARRYKVDDLGRIAARP